MSEIIHAVKNFKVDRVEVLSSECYDTATSTYLVWFYTRLKLFDQLEEVLNHHKELHDSSNQWIIYLSKAYRFWLMGYNKDCIEQLHQFDDLFQHIEVNDEEYWLGVYYNILGLISLQDNEFDKSHDNLCKSLECRQQSQDRFGEGDSYYNLGDVSKIIGDFTQADIYYRKSVEIFYNINNKFGIVMPLIQLSEVWRLRSDFIKAQVYAEQSYSQLLHNKTLLPTPPYEAYVLHRLGRVYRDLNQYQKASQFFNEALILRKNSNELEKIESYSDIINFQLNFIGSTDIDYYEKLLQNLPTHAPVVTIRKNIAMGRIYLSRKNLINLVKAMEIFNKLIKLNDIGIIDHCNIIISYIEGKLYQLMMEKDKNILMEIQEKVNHLLQLSSTHGMIFLEIESLLLSIKLHNLEFDFVKSSEQLEKAKALSIIKGSNLYLNRINNAQKRIEELVKGISLTNNSFLSNTNGRLKIETSEINAYLEDVKKLLSK